MFIVTSLIYGSDTVCAFFLLATITEDNTRNGESSSSGPGHMACSVPYNPASMEVQAAIPYSDATFKHHKKAAPMAKVPPIRSNHCQRDVEDTPPVRPPEQSDLNVAQWGWSQYTQQSIASRAEVECCDRT